MSNEKIEPTTEPTTGTSSNEEDVKTLNVNQKLHYLQTNTAIYLQKYKQDNSKFFKHYKLLDLLLLLRPLLEKARLVITQKAHNFQVINGNFAIEITIDIIDIDSQEIITFSDIQVGQFGSSNSRTVEQNKGASDTYTQKYILSKIFLIPSGEKDSDEMGIEAATETSSIQEPPMRNYKDFKEGMSKIDEPINMITIAQNKDFVMNNFLTKDLKDRVSKILIKNGLIITDNDPTMILRVHNALNKIKQKMDENAK